MNTFSEMIGVTFDYVTGDKGDGWMTFVGDGLKFEFFHAQDCCERVQIEDVCGDLADLAGSPILVAEEVSNGAIPADFKPSDDCYLWTFYRFATAKGFVTVRWLGESNGYYGVGVSYRMTKS